MPNKYRGEGEGQLPRPLIQTIEKRREPSSFEKLKQEFFDREVPEEYKVMTEQHWSPFLGYGDSSGVMGGLRVKNKEMREFLQKKIGGNTLLDLGCGNTYHPQGVAQEWKAGRYIGVDTELYIHEPGQDKSPHGEYYYFKDDMLSFVAKLKDGLGGVYLLSAIKVAEFDEKAEKYLDALVKEMSRTLKVGDIVIIGIGSSDDFIGRLGPEKYGFKLVTFPDTNFKKGPDWDIFGYKIYIKE